jgi:hypothetical protein
VFFSDVIYLAPFWVIMRHLDCAAREQRSRGNLVR